LLGRALKAALTGGRYLVLVQCTYCSSASETTPPRNPHIPLSIPFCSSLACPLHTGHHSWESPPPHPPHPARPRRMQGCPASLRSGPPGRRAGEKEDVLRNVTKRRESSRRLSHMSTSCIIPSPSSSSKLRPVMRLGSSRQAASSKVKRENYSPVAMHIHTWIHPCVSASSLHERLQCALRVIRSFFVSV
jgi:hypothetical protein